MRVLFYHTIPVETYFQAWKKGDYPGHLLYGFTHFEKFGIKRVSFEIPFNPYKNRLKLMCYNLISILSMFNQFDAIYGATHRGLELVIFLRALGLFSKPIVIWHHTAVTNSSNKIRNIISSFFYRGIDKLFFFSQPLLDASLRTGKIKRKDAVLTHWGPDLAFYDSLLKQRKSKDFFISTGRENRDLITLVKAFSETKEMCEIYLGAKVGAVDYNSISTMQLNDILKSNVRIHFVDMEYKEIALITNDAKAIVISTYDLPYTVGLTTLVEAMALGLPVITTDNMNYPIDVEVEKIGLKVPFGDINSWKKAIEYVAIHPKEAKTMGEAGRYLAERIYNLEHFSSEVASCLLSVSDNSV